ncbi:glycyl radical protein, partial [Chloroflexota bacterium]
ISTRDMDPFDITEEQKKLYKEFIEPYWKGKSFLDVWKARLPEDLRQFEEAVIFSSVARTVGGPVSIVPDYELVIKIGINGIRKRVNDKLVSLDAAIAGDYEKIVYLNALLIVCDGIETLAKRYARLAKEKAGKEKDPQRKVELEKIAEICQQVPAKPARTFREALQSFWLYHVCLWMERNATTYTPGRIDQYLYPYYKKDIEERQLTREQAQELLECLMVKFSEPHYFLDIGFVAWNPGYVAFQNMCCGGVTESGQDAVNEISYMMLQAMMDVRLVQPHLTVKYNKAKNPDSFLRKAIELAALGTGHPPFYNDEIGIKHMGDWGIPLDEAYNWNPRGCMELGLMGKLGNVTSTLAHVNMATAVERVLLNGMHRKTQTRLPVLQTGDPRNFETYEGFQDAVKTQLTYAIKKAAEAGQVLDAIQEELRPVLVTSLSFEECIENAKDVMSGGAKYSSSSELPMAGTADIVDSLAAIKKLIYEDKKLTWDELLEALDNDFEGYEQIREMCLAAPKYGNDLPEVDEIATEITRFAAGEVRKYKGLHGGRRLASSVGAAAHLAHGSHTGALPSGRKAWVPLADGISPTQGADRKGPTAVFKSLSKCCIDLYTGGTLLNMKLDPSLFKDERGIGDFMGLIKSWHDLGLYFVQFNVVSPETLRKAQTNPEKYRGLMVRVSGYSAYFVELDKGIQDDIIARTTFGGLA